ncbi:unannotated protein [freshwater metagenome]|uniref:Unannotated protein n=1 Tax=freshwater metagenome TaxID=449393 RepID=A0A6J7RR92_9ZZZZ
MNHSARVSVAERVAERDANSHDIAVGKLPGDKPFAQRPASNQLRNEIDGISVPPGLMQRDDAWVVETRGGNRFALGAGRHLGIMGFNPFDRHDAIKPFVES